MNGIHLAKHRVEADERRFVPFRPPLLIDREVQSAQEMEQARHDVFGDGNRVDAGRVREQDIALCHFRIECAPDTRRC